MTIKPVINSQKSGESKKDNHGHVQVVEQQNQNVVRSSHNHRNVVIEGHGQSPQRRGDIFDDISRHRRSPHKSGNRSKRDGHKRERERDREKVSTATSSQYHPALAKCASPHSSSPSGGKSPENVVSLPNGGSQASPSPQTTKDLINLVEETYSGYNSGDEHLVPKENSLTPDEWKNRDEQFVKAMSERGFIIKDIAEDGACLFRAISLQIYGDEEMHELIRQQTMDYIYQNREYFSHFVTEDINNYIKRKRSKDSHGNHIEIQAMSEIYNRPVELYCYKTTPINIFNSEQGKNGFDPLRLSYQRGSHYNAIVDPYNASVGVGLGLAGYEPKSQTHEAIHQSEQLQIEQTMFEDKLKTTDWEATNEAIEEEIARESYLQWCRENTQRPKTASSATDTSSSSCRASSSASTSTVTSAEVQSHSSSSGAESCGSSPKEIQKFKTSCTITNPNSSSACSNDLSTDQSSNLQLPSKMSKDSNSAEYCDSDDTDMSSTSSVDHQKDKNVISKKAKNSRISSSRTKRRRKLDSGGGCGGGGGGGVGGSSTGSNLDKKSDSGMEDKIIETKRPRQTPTPPQIERFESLTANSNNNNNNNNNNKSPQSLSPSPNASQSSESERIAVGQPCTSKQSDDDESKPLSRFYQSLLESSYTADGLGQLSETEMLQKAIQMSKIDFFEDQKRKFGF